MEANGGARPRYFVLAYDRETLAVLSLSGHNHDFTGAALTLTRRGQEYRGRPEVAVRLFAATDVPDLLARHAELFERLTFPEGVMGRRRPTKGRSSPGCQPLVRRIVNRLPNRLGNGRLLTADRVDNPLGYMREALRPRRHQEPRRKRPWDKGRPWLCASEGPGS